MPWACAWTLSVVSPDFCAVKEAALVQSAPLHGIVARRPFVESADQGMAVTVHSVGLLVSGELGRGAVVVETASGEQRTIASTEVS